MGILSQLLLLEEGQAANSLPAVAQVRGLGEWLSVGLLDQGLEPENTLRGWAWAGKPSLGSTPAQIGVSLTPPHSPQSPRIPQWFLVAFQMTKAV